MSDNNIDVKISASTNGLGAGINDAKNQINSLGEGVGELVESFKGIAASIGVAFAFDKIDAFARSMSDLGEQIERTSKMTGLSSDEVQKFQFAVKMTGGDAESAGMSLLRLERNMADAAAGSKDAQANLAAAGVSMKTLASGDVSAGLGEIADKFHATADGANKTALAMSLAGRGGASLIPILDQGRAGFTNLDAALENTVSRLTQAQVEGFTKTAEQIKIMDAATEGLSTQIMTKLNPGIVGAVTELTKMNEAMSNNIKQGDFLSTTLDVISNIMLGTTIIFDTLTTTIKATFQWLLDFLNNLNTAASNVGHIVGDILTADVDSLGEDIIKLGGTVGKALSVPASVTKSYDDLFARIKAATQAANAAVISGGDAKAKKDDRPQPKVPDKSGGGGDDEDYAGERALEAQRYDTKKETDDLMVASGKMTHREELNDLDSALKQEQALVDASFKAEEDAYEGSESGYQKLLDQQKIADQKFANDHTRLIIEQTKDDQKAWTSAFDTVAHSFDTMVNGILQGTQTIQSAFLRLAGNLILTMVDASIKIAFNWIKDEALQVQATAAAEAAKVAAKTAGAQAGAAAQKTANSASIMKDAEGAAAGTYNSVSQIPVVGWLLAPAAAAASFAAVAAYDSFDVGTPNVPHDMTAQIHQGEAIVPAKTAEKWRDGDLGVGGGGTHLHVHAMDSRDVKRFFNQHGAAIAKTLSGQVRSGNRSFTQHI